MRLLLLLMLVLLALLFLSALLFWNCVWKRRGLPPGPMPLPLLGNALGINRPTCPYASYQKWFRQFGPVYTVWLGEQPVVVVTEFGLIRDLFVKDGDAYAGRHFLNDLMKVCTASHGMLYGVIRTEGDLWKETRRFALQSMRNLGMGKAQLEERFLKDIADMIDRVGHEVAAFLTTAAGGIGGQLQQENQEDGVVGIVHLYPHINRLVGSTINQVLFGHAFNDEDQLKEFNQLKHDMDWQQQLLDSISGKSLIGMPFLRHIPPFSWTFAKLDTNLTNIFAYIDKNIEQRLMQRATAEWAQQQEGGRGESTDLLDCFLDHMEEIGATTKTNGAAGDGRGDERAKGGEDKQQYFNIENLRNVCFDLFLAGQETTSITLNFIVLYLLLDQRVQQKMHMELDKLCMEKEGVLDDWGEMITTADRTKLPYVNAVINEGQRLCNLLPLNLTHRTMADVQIETRDSKFGLGRGTVIVPQISCVLFDDKIFPEPHRFRPERFLNQSGQLERFEEMIPFGVGKRICMGESLARMELFLFTANFFRHFRVLPVDPLNPPSSKKLKGFGVRPYPYECRIERRAKAQ